MGVDSNYRPPGKRLAAHTSSLDMMLIHTKELMVSNIPSSLLLLARLHHVFLHLIFALHKSCTWKPWSRHLPAFSRAPTCIPSLMPRERGKPHRGAAWHSYAAQPKHVQKMEWALSIAQTQLQRRRIGCNAAPVAVVIMEPPVAAFIVEPPVAAAIEEHPIAYIVEEISEEPIQETSKLLIFTMSVNWDQPSDLRVEASLSSPEDYHGSRTVVTGDEFFTCYVEEETPVDLNPQDAELVLLFCLPHNGCKTWTLFIFCLLIIDLSC